MNIGMAWTPASHNRQGLQTHKQAFYIDGYTPEPLLACLKHSIHKPRICPF